jgi:hypothetical protein
MNEFFSKSWCCPRRDIKDCQSLVQNECLVMNSSFKVISVAYTPPMTYSWRAYAVTACLTWRERRKEPEVVLWSEKYTGSGCCWKWEGSNDKKGGRETEAPEGKKAPAQ